MLCKNIVLNVKKKYIFLYMFVVNLYFSWNSMNDLSSYFGLTDSRMRASDIDLPVLLVLKLWKVQYILGPYKGGPYKMIMRVFQPIITSALSLTLRDSRHRHIFCSSFLKKKNKKHGNVCLLQRTGFT